MYTIHREYSLGTPSFLAQDWFDCNDACSALHRDLVVIGPRVSTDVKCCTGTIQLHQEQGIFYTCMKSDMLTTAFSEHTNLKYHVQRSGYHDDGHFSRLINPKREPPIIIGEEARWKFPNFAPICSDYIRHFRKISSPSGHSFWC